MQKKAVVQMNVKLGKEEMMVLEGLTERSNKEVEAHQNLSKEFSSLIESHLPYIGKNQLSLYYSSYSESVPVCKVKTDYHLSSEKENYISFMELESTRTSAFWSFLILNKKTIPNEVYQFFASKAASMSFNDEGLKYIEFRFVETNATVDNAYKKAIDMILEKAPEDWTYEISERLFSNTTHVELKLSLKEESESENENEKEMEMEAKVDINIMQEIQEVIETEFGSIEGIEFTKNEKNIQMKHALSNLKVMVTDSDFMSVFNVSIGVLPYRKYFWSTDKETRLKEIKFMIEQAWGDVLFKKVHLDKLPEDIIESLRSYVKKRNSNLLFFPPYGVSLPEEYRNYFLEQTGKLLDDYHLSLFSFIHSLEVIDVENTSALFYYDGSVPSFKKPIYILIQLDMNNEVKMREYEARLLFDSKEEALEEMKKRETYLKQRMLKEMKEQEEKIKNM